MTIIKTESGGAAGAAASALTPEQALIIQTRARTVPPRWRHKFFSEVANQLALTRSPTNRDILEICGAARRSITVGIGPPSVEDW
jgi:hypothetical protein